MLIAEAARVNPTAERTLVEAAGRDSFKELKNRSLRAKAAGDQSPDATQRRIHRNRSVREYTDGEGAWNLHARGTAADAFVPPGHPRHPQQAGGSTSGDPPHVAA